tara:strand:+ start:5086 stop:6249 length:1164 start_codon:yes stop_codon:yes gene_type:complete
MFIKSIQLTNFLSYGQEPTTVDLKPLNLVIGPNGSGKSNLIEAIELIRSAPKDLLTPIRDGGGIRDWLWKGITPPPVATINAVFEYPKGHSALRYLLSFTEVSQRFEIIDERIESEKPKNGHKKPYILYKFENGHGVLNVKGKNRTLKHEDIDISASILAQRKDPDQYPEVSYLGDVFSKIRLYREWSFGRYTPPRLPQKADMRNDYLDPDCRNLGLVLNQIGRDPMAKKRIIKALQSLYEGVDDYYVQMEGGTVQVFLHEGQLSIPATRLSDGTLRYLCLLAILCHPTPPPLICIEEPELGLHPDVMPTVAELLKEASERTQLIVTTHSDILVDAMTDQPESVLVAEKNESGSSLTRLNAENLKPWLEKYRLGQLWTRGDLGGTRW